MDMRDLLKTLMELHEDDAYSLAEKSGVPQPTTQRFLSGRHGSPQSPTVKKWATAYGITESQLRGDVPLPDNLLRRLGGPESVQAQAGLGQGHLSQGALMIPQYDVAGAMSNGGLVLDEQPGVIENWRVTREWLEKNVRGGFTSVSNLCIVTGFGPSMQPDFNPGDPILVDKGVNAVVADGIYFFRVEKEGFIKQLQKIPTANGIIYRAKSSNKKFDPFDITPDMDFEVLAKVIRVWRGTDY